ncbi:MAG: right-handed parallel beta-helix repeat-containing protein [Balneolales bacterium]
MKLKIQAFTSNSFISVPLVIALITLLFAPSLYAQDCDFTVEAGNSIQDAIDQANSGEVVCVGQGTYDEDLTIVTQGLSIIALDDGDTPVLDGNSVGVLIEEADSVIISGFIIQNYSREGIEVVSSNGVEITGNTILNNGRFGISNSFEGDSEGLVVTDNMIAGNNLGGITFYPNDGSKVIGNTIEGNSGYALRTGGSAVVTDNIIIDNEHGLWFNGPESEITNNTITGHTIGLVLTTSGGNANEAVVEGNVISENDRALSVSSDNVQILDNTLSDNKLDLEFINSSNNTVTNNSLSSGLAFDNSNNAQVNFTHNFVNNTFNNGDVLFYAEGEDNPAIPSNARQVVIVNSTNVDISGLSFDEVLVPIQVAYSDGAEITGNTITNSPEIVMTLLSSGMIMVWNSHNAVLEDNTVSDNQTFALQINDSENTLVSGNTFSDNTEGIIFRNSNSADVIDNTISGVYNTGFHDGNGIWVVSSENLEITNNTISGNAGHGIHDARISSSDGIVISGNEITDNGNYAIYWFDGGDITVTENTITENGGGFRGGSNSIATDNVITHNGSDHAVRVSHWSTVNDNLIADNQGAGITVNQESEVSRNTVTDNGGNAGIFLANYTDYLIQDNVVTGQEADIILRSVSNVTLTGNTIGNGVLLDTDTHDFEHFDHQMSNNTVGGDALFFANGVSNPSIPNDAGQIIIVNSDQVSVTDHEVEGVTSGIQIAYSDGATVSGNTITGSGPFWLRRGLITIWESENATVEENTLIDGVHGLEMLGSRSGTINLNMINSDVEGAHTGIHLVGSGLSEVAGNTVMESFLNAVRVNNSDTTEISENHISNGRTYGMLLENTDDLVVSDNEVSGSGEDGLYFANSQGALVTGNRITQNGENGMLSGFGFNASEGIEINNNTISNNGAYGINFRVDTVLVSGNTIQENQSGIRVGNPAEITDNFVHDNVEFGIEVDDDAEEVFIQGNSIQGNGEGLVFSSSGIVDARENWWGDDSGPGGEAEDPETEVLADGDGDSVDPNIRFDPWLMTDPLDQQPGSYFAVNAFSSNSPVSEGEILEVEVSIHNTGQDEATQNIEFKDLEGSVVDSESLTLSGGEKDTLLLSWETTDGDAGDGDVIISSDDESSSISVFVMSGDMITVTECMVIDTPGGYLLGDHLTGSETCIEITIGNVFFDGMDYSITGEDLVSSIESGIHVNGSEEKLTNVVIRNVNLDNWGNALNYIGADEGEITGVTLANSNRGLNFMSAVGNKIDSLTARDNSWGLAVGSPFGDGSSANIFSNITAVDNEDYGLYASNSTDSEFRELHLTGNEKGLYVITANENLFSDVTANDNSMFGLEINSSSHSNTYTEVRADTNGWYGIYLKESDDNEFEELTLNENELGGLVINGDMRFNTPVTGNMFTTVSATGNGESGVNLSVGADNEFRELELSNNAGVSLNLASRNENNLFEDITISGGENHGLSVTNGSHANIFSGLAISGQGSEEFHFGIQVGEDSHHNEIKNAAINTSQNGLSLSTDSTVVDTLAISDISGSGIRLWNGAVGNILSDLTLNDNTVDFESIDEADENTVNRMELDHAVLSFSARDVRIHTGNAPDELPGDADQIEYFVEITASELQGADPYVDYVHFHFEAESLESLDENSYGVWRYNDVWNAPQDETYTTGVDTDELFVFAEGITEFSTFGVFNNDVATSIGKEEIPTEFMLSRNFPNPFNPSTQIRYALPEVTDVRLDVYNLLGQHVATLVNSPQQPGWHDVTFDAGNLSSGVYIYRLQAGDFVKTRKLTLLK